MRGAYQPIWVLALGITTKIFFIIVMAMLHTKQCSPHEGINANPSDRTLQE